MPDWTEKLGPAAATREPVEVLRVFSDSDAVVDAGDATWTDDGWRIDALNTGWVRQVLHLGRTVELFTLPLEGRTGVLLVYQAKLRPESLSGRAYLEMWCRVGGREFFSRGHGFGEVVAGTGDWSTLETPFLVQSDQRVESARLNVVIEGRGVLYIKDVQLISRPLAQV